MLHILTIPIWLILNSEYIFTNIFIIIIFIINVQMKQILT